MPADALKCKECKTEYPAEARYVCDRCFGPLEVAYSRIAADPAELKRRIQAGPHTLWRYADFLPLDRVPRASLPTGWTPLVRADRLAERLGLRELWIKNETANPTHSFKDRVVTVALARASATETTRSLNECVGFAVSFLIHSSPRPRRAASRSARTSGVHPVGRYVRGTRSTGRKSA